MKNILVLFILVLLCGCATPVQQAQVQQPITIPIGKETKPIQFKKIVVKIARGAPIGSIQAGLLCVQRENLVWRGGKMTISGDEFTDVFREELQKANYTVVGNPDALFDDPSEWKAEFLVAGLVNNIQASVCYPYGGMGNWNSSKGAAFIKVNWQVYSSLHRKVVYETATEGSSKVTTASSTGGSDLLLNAFAVATQNLLANKGFSELVTGTKEVKQESFPTRVTISKLDQFRTPLNEHINDVRAGVVTVFAGGGHGSGFFISSDGYLLTCYHVVKEAKIVKIKLATGRELIAEVIRADSRRDVALLKSEEGNMIPLRIREQFIGMGDEVFSVGSPLQEKLSLTISKGIVSAFRVEEGTRLIQSDTNILPGCSGGPLVDNKGNVVGIASSGILIGKAAVGLNFFIPIDETFQTLNIERITK
jgi:S1-C subfamily serine protease